MVNWLIVLEIFDNFLVSVISLFIGAIFLTWFAFKAYSYLYFEIFGLILFFILLIATRLITSEIYKKSGIKDVDKFTGDQFELWVKKLFEDYGYKVETTKKTGDFGADLIIKKGNLKFVVQAKRYKSNVGIKAIQEAIAAVNFYGCNGAIVCTNSYFTESAKKLAKANNVILYDRDKLLELSLGRLK